MDLPKRVCGLCLDDIEDLVMVEGKPFVYCEECLRNLMKRQFSAYITSLIETTCETDFESLVAIGPPVYFRDLNLETKERVVVKEWKIRDEVHSGKVCCFDENKIAELWEALKEVNVDGDYMGELKVVLRSFGLLS